MIIRKDHSNNVHFVGFVLYTNWAAIDLTQQTIQFKRQSQPTSRLNMYTNEAPRAVLRLGILNAIIQSTLCIMRNQKPTDEEARKKWTRWSIINIGMLLPVSALLYDITTTSDEREKFSVSQFLTFYFGGMYFCVNKVWPETDFVNVSDARPIAVVPAATFTGFIRKIVCSWKFYRDICTFLLVVTLMAGPLIADRLWLKRGFEAKAELMYTWYPCTPQSIAEWDQAFSLFLGLFCFCYEFGGAIFKFVAGQIRLLCI